MGGTAASACRLAMSKIYRVNQLFDRLTAHAVTRPFAMEPSYSPTKAQLETTLAMIGLTERINVPASELAVARGIGWSVRYLLCRMGSTSSVAAAVEPHLLGAVRPSFRRLM
jgi:hypothetical protein